MPKLLPGEREEPDAVAGDGEVCNQHYEHKYKLRIESRTRPKIAAAACKLIFTWRSFRVGDSKFDKRLEEEQNCKLIITHWLGAFSNSTLDFFVFFLSLDQTEVGTATCLCSHNCLGSFDRLPLPLEGKGGSQP